MNYFDQRLLGVARGRNQEVVMRDLLDGYAVHSLDDGLRGRASSYWGSYRRS